LPGYLVVFYCIYKSTAYNFSNQRQELFAWKALKWRKVSNTGLIDNTDQIYCRMIGKNSVCWKFGSSGIGSSPTTTSLRMLDHSPRPQKSVLGTVYQNQCRRVSIQFARQELLKMNEWETQITEQKASNPDA
jgi:hypothetical protein